MNIISFHSLLKEMNCSEVTLRIYLDRFEFSHIQRFRIKNKSLYKGITEQDKKRLKELITRSKRKKGKEKNDTKCKNG